MDKEKEEIWTRKKNKERWMDKETEERKKKKEKWKDKEK